MARTRRITHWPKFGDKLGDFVIDESEAKIFARAMELMLTTVGNTDVVCSLLSLETGRSTMAMIGFAKLARAWYGEPGSVYIEEWQESREFFPLA